MKRKLIYTYILSLAFIAAVGACFPCMAQMKIGDNARTLNPDAILEMESTNRGLILPRVSLRSTSAADPMKTFTAGMMVYNIATINNVSPGIYFSDGKKWIKANENASIPDNLNSQNAFWSLNGNGSVGSNHFLGSTNTAPLSLRTSNTERLRVTENGWVGIGTSAPKATLHVKGQLAIDSLSTGNSSTDKWLVANPSDGRVKLLTNAPFLSGLQNTTQIVAANGQSVFQTPATITDANKIFLFRNGVLISFAVNSNNSILAELPCAAGDQIKIVQLL